MPKSYLLFDNDGVLVETERFYFLATQKALAERGVTLTLDYYQTIMPQAITAWHLMSQAGYTQADIDAARDLRNRYYQEFLKSEPLYIDGVAEVIQELAKKYQMAIITTSRREDFEIIHKDRKLTQHMEFILCEEDYPRAKPHPDPYLKGIELLKAPKEQTLVIEDSQRGLNAALAAGIECAVVHNDFTATHTYLKLLIKSKRLKSCMRFWTKFLEHVALTELFKWCFFVIILVKYSYHLYFYRKKAE